PQEIEDDWVTNFFDKCRLISDEQMQNLWSKVLAGEANSPGKFSKRTVNLLASLDKAEAGMFQNLCSFNWILDGDFVPIIFNFRKPIYNDAEVTFDIVKHLGEIGLISVDFEGRFVKNKLLKKQEMS